MKTVSNALLALLAGTEFMMADLLTITMTSGAVLRLTSSDMDITFGGNIFTSKGPYFKRSAVKCKIGVEVDALDLDIYGDSTMMIGGQPILSAIRAGALDWATVRLERAFMATWGDTSAGTVILFTGRVSDTSTGRTAAKVSVKGITDLLNIQMPKNVWQAACLNVLYDANSCAVVRSSFTVTGSVSGTSSVNLIGTTLANPDGYFNQGSIKFTSGVLNGLTFTIKNYLSDQITPLNAFPSAPAGGDTFLAVPGCDHTQATCSAKFNNLAHFRGMPFIPTPEMAF